MFMSSSSQTPFEKGEAAARAVFDTFLAEEEPDDATEAQQRMRKWLQDRLHERGYPTNQKEK